MYVFLISYEFGHGKQFRNARKLGGNTMISYFEQKLENAMDEKFDSFGDENEEKRKKYVVSIFQLKSSTHIVHFHCTQF